MPLSNMKEIFTSHKKHENTLRMINLVKWDANRGEENAYWLTVVEHNKTMREDVVATAHISKDELIELYNSLDKELK